MGNPDFHTEDCRKCSREHVEWWETWTSDFGETRLYRTWRHPVDGHAYEPPRQSVRASRHPVTRELAVAAMSVPDPQPLAQPTCPTCGSSKRGRVPAPGLAGYGITCGNTFHERAPLAQPESR